MTGLAIELVLLFDCLLVKPVLVCSLIGNQMNLFMSVNTNNLFHQFR